MFFGIPLFLSLTSEHPFQVKGCCILACSRRSDSRVQLNSLPTYRRALLSERLEQASCIQAIYSRVRACVNRKWRLKMAPLSTRFEVPFLRNQRITEPQPLEIFKSTSKLPYERKKKRVEVLFEILAFRITLRRHATFCHLIVWMKPKFDHLYRKLYSNFVVTFIFNILQNENGDFNNGLAEVLC